MMSSSLQNLEKYQIPLEEIIRATNNFSSETQIGDGGFGIVHIGQLSENRENRTVAIKRRNHDSYQGNSEFCNELMMVSGFHHPNIINFIGYCDEANEMIIVYEYAMNGSLDRHLEDPNKWRCISWEKRLGICLGAAKGLKCLHSGIGEDQRVIHRDVKSANILLDENLEAKICDFGLSKFGPRNKVHTQVVTKASGTRFYMDPVYHERGRLSKESDVYSFGVVLFEMSSGMLAYHSRCFGDGMEQYLLDLVRSYYDDHEVDGLDKLIDLTIRDDINMTSFHTFNEIAHQCINFDSKKRPTMDRIINEIEKALDIQMVNDGRLKAEYGLLNLNSMKYNEHASILSNQNSVNAMNLNELSIDCNNGDRPTNLPDSSSGNHSPPSCLYDEGVVHGEAVMKFIQQMLMEEDDLGEQSCLLQESDALQATEKSVYDALM